MVTGVLNTADGLGPLLAADEAVLVVHDAAAGLADIEPAQTLIERLGAHLLGLVVIRGAIRPADKSSVSIPVPAVWPGTVPQPPPASPSRSPHGVSRCRARSWIRPDGRCPVGGGPDRTGCHAGSRDRRRLPERGDRASLAGLGDPAAPAVGSAPRRLRGVAVGGAAEAHRAERTGPGLGCGAPQLQHRRRAARAADDFGSCGRVAGRAEPARAGHGLAAAASARIRCGYWRRAHPPVGRAGDAGRRGPLHRPSSRGAQTAATGARRPR